MDENEVNCDRFLIKLRGLPWESTAKDVIDFLQDVEIVDGEKGVYMAVGRDGRLNGEAYVELATSNDLDTAFGYNKNTIGRRYIEIFNVKPQEFDNEVQRISNPFQDTFVKLRGLPFSCKLEDIEQFFTGLEIKNGKTGIFIVYDSNGRMSGEAFVQFKTFDDAENALKRNREKIGHRYIEIFRSSSSEARRATLFGNDRGGMNRGGNDRNMGRGGQRNRNFRDRPYPDWSGGNNNNGSNNDGPGGGGWRRGGNFGSNNNFNNDNFGPGGGSRGGNNFNNDNFDFERNWKSGGNNFNNRDNDGPPSRFGGNSFGGGGNNGGSGNNFFNNRNSNNDDMSPRGNFGSDRGTFNMNSGPNGPGPGILVHMRGMPYDCGEMEVNQFFAPLKLVGCDVIYNNGRHTGEADAYFATVADAQEAMKRHKEKMGSRYIELFANRNTERRGRF